MYFIKVDIVFIYKLTETYFSLLAFIVKRENSEDLVYNDYATLEDDFKNSVIFFLYLLFIDYIAVIKFLLSKINNKVKTSCKKMYSSK